MGGMLIDAAKAANASPHPVTSARPIRVARVIARLNVGGPAQHVTFLSAGMDRTRFHTMLMTGIVGENEGDFLPAARSRGLQPILIPQLGPALRPAHDLVSLMKLVRLFREFRPDIVHTHTAKAGALGRLAARLAGVPLSVHTFHGHVLEGYFSPLKTRLFLVTERALARITDRIIAVSARVRQALLSMAIGRPEQVEVIPLGLDLSRFTLSPKGSSHLRQRLCIPPGAPILGTVGRLVPIKDHPTLIHALALLAGGDRAPHLLVVGDGERREALQQLVQHLNLGSRVHFLGWRDDLEAILPELNVVICCSRNEGTPVALIEAMAAGVPVLSSDVGGVADLVTHGETGWLVPPGDPTALADGIRTLLADPALAGRLAEAARPVALTRHDVKRMIHRMETLYGDLMADERCR
jgi:glycosyltransferase involved in cell wall biosynthesis